MSGNKPRTATREDLYAQVWETPMSRLAEDYSHNSRGLQCTAIHGLDDTGRTDQVEFGRLSPVLVLFDGREPEPRHLAATLMPAVGIVIFRKREDGPARCAADVEPPTPVAFSDIMDV